MALWTKPNGNKIETNDFKETIAYCKSLDWKLAVEEKGDRKVSKPKKK